MKFFISILIIFSYQASFGQRIIFEPTFINQCTNMPDSLVFWYLSDDSNNYGLDTNNSKSVNLPQLGEYWLIADNSGIMSNTIKISNYGIIRDTFLLPRLVLDYYTIPPKGYFDCDSLANGKVTDCFLNGNKRIEGTFQNGDPIDSLSIFYQNGQLKVLFIPLIKYHKRYNYFDNGQIKSIYDGKKRYNKEYYKEGQLKSIFCWTRKYKTHNKEFYQNGNIKLTQTNRNLRHYNHNGILTKKISRKKKQNLDKKSAKELYGQNWKMHNNKYNYKWENYDSLGFLSQKVFFHSSGELSEVFPDSLQQVPYSSFDKIILYINGIEFEKIEFFYEKKNEKYIRKQRMYIKENENWVEEKTTTANTQYKKLGRK